MATWKDGAAYAPVERPDGFTTPTAAPLESAEPYHATTPGAIAPPERFDSAPQRPLDQVVAQQRSSRNPQDSFSVASMLLSESSPGPERRDPKVPFASSVAHSEDAISPPSGPPLVSQSTASLAPGFPGKISTLPKPGLATKTHRPTEGSASTEAKRRLAIIAAGLCLLGAFYWPMTGWLLVLAAAVNTMSAHGTKFLSGLCLTSGVLVLGLQQRTSEVNYLGGLAAICLAVAFLTIGLRQTR